MNDLRFAALIKEGGKTAGLSEEEFGHYLIRLFQNPPKEFAAQVKAWLSQSYE